ncbi:MAG: class II aldolase/adducin family protein [Deltaproteobacteria bacterium]|nr:class II aldolase/adducin family protein [Deltaproteobacteria bacterium]
MADPLNELRQKIAIAMRVLAMQGCVSDILGHVSARIPDTDEMFIRCRGGNERGLIYTDVQQIRRLGFSEKAGVMLDGFMVPQEVAIHGEIYKSRRDVNAIVHAHPYASLICGVAGLKFRPVVGAYDPTVLAIAARGVPVYPRSVLINSVPLATELIAAIGTANCCLMKGHGITTVGSSVEGAALLALRLEKLAQITLELSRLGKSSDISAEDMDFFGGVIRQGISAFVPEGDKWIWVHLVELLRDGVGIPQDL